MSNVTDELPVFVTLQDERFCDCCKHKHMRRVFRIESTLMDTFNLGYVCAGYWFKINLSGNIGKARQRLQAKLRSMPNEEILRIIDNIFDENYKAGGE